MSKAPKQTPLVQRLPETVPFVGPEAQERMQGAPFLARIGANENVFGPSPKTIEAMKNAAPDIWMYADPEAHELRDALADCHNVDRENIVVGGGIDTLLGCVVRLYVEPGVTVVTSLGAYPTFNFHVNGYGGTLEQVPYINDHEDPAGLIKRAREKNASLIYLSNPDNPMGTSWPAAAVQRMINDLPAGTMLLLDEAYLELAPKGVAPDIDVNNEQVLRFRTFSKAYGMAGARVGYCIGNGAIIRGFEKVRNHFGMNRSAEIGALAALHDQEYLQKTKEKIAAAREAINQIAIDVGFQPLPSATR